MSEEPLVVGTRDIKANHVEVGPDHDTSTGVAPVGTRHLLTGDHIALCDLDDPKARMMHPIEGLAWDDPASDLLRCGVCAERAAGGSRTQGP